MKKFTKYYFVGTNADNYVIATDGKYFYNCPVDYRGIDVTSGVDLYQTNSDNELDIEKILCELRQRYINVYGLYRMQDIISDYNENVYECDENFYEDFEFYKVIVTVDNNTGKIFISEEVEKND